MFSARSCQAFEALFHTSKCTPFTPALTLDSPVHVTVKAWVGSRAAFFTLKSAMGVLAPVEVAVS